MRSRALNKLMVIVVAAIVIIAGVGIYLWQLSAPTQTTTTTTTTTTTSSSSTTTTTTSTTTSTSTTITTTTTTGPKKVLRIGIGTDADTLDTAGQTTTTINNIVSFVCEPLTYYDEKGNMVYWLAESHTTSSDGLHVTMKLKKNIKFQDGTPFNAAAVKFTYDRLLNPQVKVPNRNLLAALNTTEVVDEYTVRFNLKFPYAPFIRVLSNFYIISPSQYAVLGEDNMARNLYNLGTGPLKFKEWVKGDRMVFVKFDEYWGGPISVDEVVFKVIPEAQTREAMLLSGDLDMILSPPPTDVSKLSGTPGVKVIVSDSTRVMTVNLYTAKGPFSDVRVRQAVNYAVDKEAIIKNIVFGLGTISDSSVPPSFFGYSHNEPYEYNPEKAKKLLADAGYPDGFTCKMMVPTGRYLFDRQVGEAIQSYLGKVGIKVELFTPDWPTFVSQLLGASPTNSTWDMTFVGYAMTVPDADAMLYPTMHSSQWAPGKFNTMIYKNEKVDSLLDQARREVDPNKRLSMYAEAQKEIWNDCPWIFLYVQKFIIAHSDKVSGLVVYPYETFDIRTLKMA